jgi:hypothetical protein
MTLPLVIRHADHHPPARNRRPSTTIGNAVIDWASPDELDITGCSVQPVAAPETVDGRARDAVARRWFVVAPPGADITALDRAVYGGRAYDVDGGPSNSKPAS